MVDRAHRRLATIGSLVAGVVVAHVAGYALVYPVAGARAAHLHDTGHGYWPVAVAAALVAGLAAVAAVARDGWRGRRVVPPALRLGVLQALVFTAVEVGERAAVGMAPAELLRSHEFVVGLLLQFVVAGVTVLLLRGVASVAAVAARRPRPRRSTRPVWAMRPALLCGRLDVAPVRSRAPPLLD